MKFSNGKSLNYSFLIVRHSCYGETNEKVAYYTNPSFPASDNDPNYCTYTVKVISFNFYQTLL